MKAIIVEDEMHNVAVLKHFLKKYCSQVEILGEATSVNTAFELVNNTKPDLIFLDIMLAQGTGFDLLGLIKDKEIQVIFITAYNNFALQAIKYSAIDYLLKPLQIEELEIAVEKAEKRLKTNTAKKQLEILIKKIAPKNKKDDDNYLAISMTNKVEFIKIEDIIYIKADGKYSSFTIKNAEEVISSKNLGEYEKIFSDNNNFIRIHHSYIINTAHLERIQKENGLFCEMKNKEILPISRRKKEDLYKHLGLK